MNLSLIQCIGLSAPPMFLYAYAMVSLGRWRSTELRFHLLNLIGAVFILISLIEQWNLPMFILECAWGTISLYGCIKALRLRAYST